MIEMRNFFLQLETTLGSGINLVRALNLIAVNLKGWGLRTKVERMAKMIDQGSTFSEAMQRVGSPFGPMQISFIKFGEQTGCLDKVCGSLAAHSEREVNLNREIINAVLYPGFVLFVALCLGPVISSIMKNEPLLNAIFPATINLVIFFGAIAGCYFFSQYTAAGGLSSVLVRIPFFGMIFQYLALARFTRALSVGLFAGVPILQAMSTAIDVSGNSWLKEQLKHLPAHVSGGKTLTSGLLNVECLPGTLKEMITVGEQSGKLPEMLEKTAYYFEEEAGNRVKMTMKILPAMVFLIVAIYVGFMIVTAGITMIGSRLEGIN